MGEPQKCAGVAFFGESSVDADLKALGWACRYLHLSKTYKLQNIHLNKLDNEDPPPELRYGSRYIKHEVLEEKFDKMYPNHSKEIFSGVQSIMQSRGGDFKKCIGGVTYEGGKLEAVLERAIEKEHVDILVLAMEKEPPIKCLKSQGCAIVLLHSGSLTFTSPSSTQGSTATATVTAAAAAQSPMLPAHSESARS